MNFETFLIESIAFQKQNQIYEIKIHKNLQERIQVDSKFGKINIVFKNRILNVFFEEFFNYDDIPIDFITIVLKIPNIENFITFLHQGYNNWTQTYEVPIQSKQKNVSSLVKWLLASFSEHTIIRYINKFSKYLLRSHFYTYLRDKSNSILMFCSLNEKTSYTIFQLDYQNSNLKIIKDFQNFIIASNMNLYSLYINYGDYYKIFDSISDLLEPPKIKDELVTGYTTWYYHYNNLNFNELLKRIEFINSNAIPIGVFQIDDGYQKRVGDWLHLKSDFDNRMKELASRIKQYKMKAGIWLAPFICEQKSYLYQYHPEWILKDKKGRFVVAGFNPLWSGKFYALNIYHPDFQEYIKHVLNVFTQEWGFELLKLDFLYAACIYPIKRKTRAIQMQDALDFIHSVINWRKGNIKILGCGIPFSHAFGNVNYTRIGSDVEEKWENFLKKFNFLERVSTFNSLNSTIYRHSFNTKNFINDPDVFYLRDKFRALKKSDLFKKIFLTEEEKLTLLYVNHILGGLVFTSDPIENYNKEQLEFYRRLFPFSKKYYTKFLPINPEAFEIRFFIKKNKFYLDREKKNQDEVLKYVFFTNLSEKEVSFNLDPNQMYFVSFPFHREYGEFINTKESLILKPHHSLLLYMANPKPNQLLGSDGSIFPLSEIKSFSLKKSEFNATLEEKSFGKTTTYICISPKEKQKLEKKYHVQEWKSILYIKKEFLNSQ
ncbi:MAG: glycoside hydrolase family 36 protein [Leptonema sp. (in: bacteria)]